MFVYGLLALGRHLGAVDLGGYFSWDDRSLIFLIISSVLTHMLGSIGLSECGHLRLVDLPE